jgi:hypothetical protein
MDQQIEATAKYDETEKEDEGENERSFVSPSKAERVVEMREAHEQKVVEVLLKYGDCKDGLEEVELLDVLIKTAASHNPKHDMQS